MRESLKTSVNTATVWGLIVILCIFTLILGVETVDMLLEPMHPITLEQTATQTKSVTPTGDLYLLSSIQENYIMSNDENVQKILTSFGVNLKQNIVGISTQNDCSQSALAKLSQSIEQNRILGRFAENLELKQRFTLCEEENKRRNDENDKIFIITLNEKCGYYLDLDEVEISSNRIDIDSTIKQLQIKYHNDALKVKCMPQKIQFLSNVESFWAEHADDRAIDAIKEHLEASIIQEFSQKYNEKALENTITSLTSLFCAMKYKNIIINDQAQTCPAK